MRVIYISPSPKHFDLYFNPVIRGGGQGDINIYRKRGGGFFGILGNVVRRSIPFLKRIILPEIGSLAYKITNDISQGGNFAESVKQNAINSAKKIAHRVARGGGKKIDNSRTLKEATFERG